VRRNNARHIAAPVDKGRSEKGREKRKTRDEERQEAEERVEAKDTHGRRAAEQQSQCQQDPNESIPLYRQACVCTVKLVLRRRLALALVVVVGVRMVAVRGDGWRTNQRSSRKMRGSFFGSLLLVSVGLAKHSRGEGE